MARFEVEHIGFTVADPVAMAAWYERVLGFNIRMCKRESEEKAGAFVADPAGAVVLEFIQLPGMAPAIEGCTDGLQLHVALKSQDIEADVAHLVANGAEFVRDCGTPTADEHVCLLRDPWGNYLQLAKRHLAG